ncbi:MAG: hypothetical protein KDJ35_09270 [Alphaproteobacteria bacterium]|nr:hypothetical protein [Alphaproteobacteria bacterium]
MSEEQVTPIYKISIALVKATLIGAFLSVSIVPILASITHVVFNVFLERQSSSNIEDLWAIPLLILIGFPILLTFLSPLIIFAIFVCVYLDRSGKTHLLFFLITAPLFCVLYFFLVGLIRDFNFSHMFLPIIGGGFAGFYYWREMYSNKKGFRVI